MRILAVLILIALALLHWVLPGQVERSMNLVREHAPYAIREEAQTLHDSLFIADLHTDSLLWKRDLGEHMGLYLCRKKVL